MKHFTQLILLLLLLCNIPISVNAQLQSATTAYCITNENGQIIAEKDKKKTLLPASITKLITTATALEVLGKDFRFKTLLGYNGTLTPDGTLNGDLYIVGYGDPTLGSPNFSHTSSVLSIWTEAIKKHGIKHIHGNIIADDSYFDTEGASSQWLVEDIGNYYAAGAYGLNIYDNTYRLYLQSDEIGSKVQVVRCDPPIEGLQWISYAQAAPNQKDSIYIQGASFQPIRYIYGTMPAHQTAFEVKGAIPDPPLFLASLLKKELTAHQIKVTGKITTARILNEERKWTKPEMLTEIVQTTSPTLQEIIRIINWRSHNLYTEALLRQLAVFKNKTTKGTRNAATRMLMQYWEHKGIDTREQFMADGCGLSRLNTLSPLFFTQVLNRMRTETHFTLFKNTIPIAGKEGTVAAFLKGTRLEGKVRAKSGSMHGVLCYAGYIYENNRSYTFAIMVNNHHATTRQVRKEIENILLKAIPQS